jgi:FAD synthase
MLSLGTNPTFDTKEDTVEAYIFHNFEADFYGKFRTFIGSLTS